MFSVWLVYTSNLKSQTTWLKVKYCKLEHAPNATGTACKMIIF